MDETKQKLMEWINTFFWEITCGEGIRPSYTEELVDSLIQRGVILKAQEDADINWIMSAERVPTVNEADPLGNVLTVGKSRPEGTQAVWWRTVANNPQEFTYWKPMPLPIQKTNQ